MTDSEGLTASDLHDDNGGQEDLLNHAVMAQHAAEQQQHQQQLADAQLAVHEHHQQLVLDPAHHHTQAVHLHELHHLYHDHMAQMDPHAIDPNTGMATAATIAALQQHHQAQVQAQHQAQQQHQHQHQHQQAQQQQQQQQQQDQGDHMLSVNAAAAAVAAVEDHLSQTDPSHMTPSDSHLHAGAAMGHQHLSSSSPSQKSKRVQTRRSWTPEEDKRLMELVKTDGTNCWSQIATHLEGRVGKQCRERWRNHLDPNIRRECFTPEEDEHILELVQEMGTRWSKIAQRLPGRTENAVKNRYHCFLKNRDTNTGKRGREEKGILGLKHKRQADKSFMLFDSELGGGKGSPEGNFPCNLMGCGKTFSQLSHLLAHRLTHFADGRHPVHAQQMVVPTSVGDPSHQQAAHQQQQQVQHPGGATSAETVMLVRSLDGLMDDLLSNIPNHHRSAHEQGDGVVGSDPNSIVKAEDHVLGGEGDPNTMHHHHHQLHHQMHHHQMHQATPVMVAGLVVHPHHHHAMGHMVALHPQFITQVDLGQHVEQYVVADPTGDGLKA